MPNPNSTRKPRGPYRKKAPSTGIAAATAPPIPDNNAALMAVGQPIATSHFELREDGTISVPSDDHGKGPSLAGAGEGGRRPDEGREGETNPSRESSAAVPELIYSDLARRLWLYHGNSLELLDAIYEKFGDDGHFDAIFADPPYFLSNGGITCHAGKMVQVDKGAWDKSRGPEMNHEFNLEWLRRCQRVLKPHGTIWVSGTHHVIFSIGYAMQQLGFKILNDIAWEKPNPPPNLSCRYFTHSTETILWAAKNEKSKHRFNYSAMRSVTGKQMKTVWRKTEFPPEQTSNQQLRTHHGTQENETVQSLSPLRHERGEGNCPSLAGAGEGGRRPDEGRGDKNQSCGEVSNPFSPGPSSILNPPSSLENIWTLTAPGNAEKSLGKHPTQKPVALLERCLLASTNEGDLVFDPFLGGGTTAVACIRLHRACIGIELDADHLALATRRADHEIIHLWLRTYQIRVHITFTGRAELPLCPNIKAPKT